MTKEFAEFANEIAQAQVDGLGIQSLSRILMMKIRKPVIFIDPYGKVLSWHSPYDQDFQMEENVTIPSTVRDFEEIPMHGITVIGEERVPFLIWPINEDKIMGYLLILHRQIQTFEENFVNITCRAAMIEIARKQELYHSIQEYKDDFIRDILFNNYDGFDTALRAGKMWGWDFSIPYIVLVLDVKSEDHDVKMIRPMIEEKIGMLNPGCIVGKVGDAFVILFPVTEEVKEKWKAEIRNLYEEAKALLGGTPFSLGVGKLYPESNMLYRSYQQAKVALDLGELSKSQGVSFFDELGALRLFYNQSGQDLEEFIDEILGPIIRYDDGKENQLLFTLWEYFRAGANIATATKNLYIHGNTLRYRLKKAEELLGKSLDDIETKFNVYGALKVAAMVGKL